MKNNNIKLLAKIPPILEIKEMNLSLYPDAKQALGKELWQKALANSRKVTVYRIIYKSQGNRVLGFIVEPKNLSKKSGSNGSTSNGKEEEALRLSIIFALTSLFRIVSEPTRRGKRAFVILSIL